MEQRAELHPEGCEENRKQCCTVLQGLLISSTLNSLTAEFQTEFPDLAIKIV